MPGLFSGIIGFFQGVPIFFAMSGLLIWNSLGKSKDFWTYAKNRFWRIYPELWCAVALGLIAILLLYKEPIQWGMLGVFTVTQSTVLQFWTPDFLRGYGCGTPNGALWTICVLIQFYLAAYFLYRWLHGKKMRVWVVTFVGAVAISALSPLVGGMVPEILYKLYNQTLIPYLWLFILGAMVAENRDAAIPALKKCWPILLGVTVLLTIIKIDIDASYSVCRCTTLILGLIGFAYSIPQLNIKIDISYGIYLYHMVVINAMIALKFTGNPIWLLIAALLSCALAFVSERTIGRLSLRKKQ